MIREAIQDAQLSIRTAPQLGIKGLEKHHVATNKGSWRRVFADLFQAAKMNLSDKLNIIKLPSHFDPHRLYNYAICTRLTNAVQGLVESSAAYRKALRKQLLLIRKELRNPNSDLS